MLKTPYLSTKPRFLLLIIAALLFGLNQTAYAEGLSGLKESLNKGKTSIKVSDDKDAKLLKTKVNSRSNKVLNAFQKYDPYRTLENTKEVYIDKANLLVNTIKIKTNHPKSQFLKTSEETIKKLKKLKPTISSKQKQFKIPQIIENNQKRKSARRIDDLVKLELPAKADKTETAPSITVPSPEKDFNFPLDKNDKIRISGEIEVRRLYELAISTIPGSAENEAIIQKMMTIADEILKKYNAYPDLCAISKFYIIDAWAHLNIDSEYSNGSFFPAFMVGVHQRDYFKKYLQIMLDYNHENNKPNMSKLLSYIYENRIKIIINNDDKVYEYIEEYSNKLKEDVEFLDRYVNGTAFPSEDPEMYIKVVVSTINEIIEDYKKIYNCSVTASDYEFAEYLLSSEFKDGKLTFSGAIKEFYDSIPKEMPYYYIAGYDEQNKPIIKTKIVEIYKTPARLIEAIQSHRNAELLKYEQTFLDDEYNTNITQKKIEAISEWFKNYEPDREGKNGAPEKMSQLDVDYLHNNAYGPDNYYKNSHVIKKIYFTRNENVELIDDIPAPDNLITIRAEIETSSANAPFYENKIKIENLKTPARFKKITLKKDYILGGYYSKFQPNDNEDYTDNNKNLIDATHPADDNSINTKSISTYQGEKKFDCPPALWKTPYFNLKLMRAVIKELYNSDDDENIISSTSFLKAGGCEYVIAKKKQLIAKALIKHTADYFLVTGHGSYSTGSIMESGYNANNVTIYKMGISPENLIKTENGNVVYSEYKNMRVLILAICNCLNHHSNSSVNNAEKWHKVLPNDVILGYHNKTWNICNDNAMKKMAYHLSESSSQNFTPYTIGYLWAFVNTKAFEESKSKYNSHANFAYLFKGAYFYGVKTIKKKQNIMSLKTAVKPVSFKKEEN